jgi:hypothetical protein
MFSSSIGFSLSAFVLLAALAESAAAVDDWAQISGIYPHLATTNTHGECGTGAVVPWADRLWVITYSPHSPNGSTDKLYEIDGALNISAWPESVGGTPANRFIHRESQQLFIGPYVIDAECRVRVVPPSRMFGRLTGTARHLTDPANKVYYATMEEGIYEVDVHSLEVTELFRDEQVAGGFRRADLPGYHGKGLYSGQGRLVYANNGENSPLAREKPDIPSGALAEWDGHSDSWHLIRRNQFTEVTGPGGIIGNTNPASDPIWSIGWDHRSLILMALDGGQWHTYRLPKSSHSYDGAHGWNTEWPRIRDIGESDLLMTMHGAFWRFPRTFDATHSAGIAPRSNYLKVIGDFARWGDRLVMGCDDTALSEFLNKRRAKGNLAAPGQSQSNLWFIEPALLDRLGPVIGRGAVWLDEPVRADTPSDPFLFSGYDQRGLHLAHDGAEPVTFMLEVDRRGDNHWAEIRRVDVPAHGYAWIAFAPQEAGAWMRVRASGDCVRATASFAMRNLDHRSTKADTRFDGLMKPGDTLGSGGLLHARATEGRTLGVAVRGLESPAFYEMSADLQLRRVDDAAALAWMEKNVAIPEAAIGQDAASIIYTDEQGRRWRLPRGDLAFAPSGAWGDERAVREVCTERDLLNCGGTFFELPAENAGGIAKVRPIATHNRRIHDFSSWRGLLVLTGVASDAPATNRHIIRSTDGRVALWAGAVDDLWQFGKPRGFGGPWKDTPVEAGVPSDPYVMTGYENKTLTLAHASAAEVRFRIEVDFAGTGKWTEYTSLVAPSGQSITHRFPDGYQAYWVRVVADRSTTATASFAYD